MRKIFKTVLLTIQYVHSKYKTHRTASTEKVQGQEYISTHKGPGYCASIAGLDEAQIKDHDLTKQEYTVMQPIMAVKERIPQTVNNHQILKTTDNDSNDQQSDPLETETYTLEDKANIILYKSHAGHWSRELKEIQKHYPWLTSTLPPLSNDSDPGFYFLGLKSDNSFTWMESEQEVQVICSSNRGLFGVKEELIDISAQLFNLLKFFDKSQTPADKEDTQIDPSFFTCRPGFQKDRVPRVLLLALHDSMTELSQNKLQCTPTLKQLFDAVDFLSINREPRNKKRNERIQSLPVRDRRDIFDIIAPAEDFEPIYGVLVKLRDNLIFNHNNIENHHVRMKSLETETMTGQQHIQLLGTLHNCDAFSRDLTKASIRNLDNLRHVNTVMRGALTELQDEAVLLANSVHYDASCFSHRYRSIQCAKDVPRVNFTAEGLVIIEYFSEDIILESRQFYTCLPSRLGLSKKHRHYSVKKSGDNILLNSGVLITNETHPDSFNKEYKHDLASIQHCFFNPRPNDHVYLNCEVKTTIQYSNGAKTEIITLEPFQLLRLAFSQFPVSINTMLVQLNDIYNKQDNVLLEDMYARVAREAWVSALHLPRALIEQHERAKISEYWTDVTQLSVKYPKLRYYFTVSLSIMILTGLGLLGVCLMKFKVNIFNCFVYLFECCKPKDSDEIRRPIGSRRRQLNDTYGGEETGTFTTKGKVKRSIDEIETGSVNRSRTRSRSRSKRRRSPQSRSPAPSYSAAASPPTSRDTSTQVRDRYSVAYKR